MIIRLEFWLGLNLGIQILKIRQRLKMIRFLICFVLDDMCHLAPYADNLVNKHDTDMTRYFAEMKKAVDFLHFKVRI